MENDASSDPPSIIPAADSKSKSFSIDNLLGGKTTNPIGIVKPSSKAPSNNKELASVSPVPLPPQPPIHHHPPPPPLLIRPTPLIIAAASSGGQQPQHQTDEVMRLSPGPTSPPPPQLYPPAAVAANQLLYSQWLASRNTSALFGLQGTHKAQLLASARKCFALKICNPLMLSPLLLYDDGGGQRLVKRLLSAIQTGPPPKFYGPACVCPSIPYSPRSLVRKANMPPSTEPKGGIEWRSTS